MALKKSLVQRLLEAPKSAARAMKICRMSSSSLSTRSRVRPDLGENGILRRLFHRRAGYQPETRPFPVVDGLMAKLKMMDAGRERLRLDGLISLPPLEKRNPVEGLNVEDARKLLRLAQLEAVKMRLRGMNECWIKHERFVGLCCEDCGDEGLRVAEILDQSGAVIVLGDMVVKTIQGLIPVPAARPNDNLKNELEEMEKEKAMIDEKAEYQVRRELWCGLAFMVSQTAGFMRLTFWELTWDVMEPICFYVTSIYFMAGYAFFLRTLKEPTFEGFFNSRLNSKQQKLMRIYKFDLSRYNELKTACSPHEWWRKPFDPLRFTGCSRR